jgi:hypothetical protein
MLFLKIVIAKSILILNSVFYHGIMYLSSEYGPLVKRPKTPPSHGGNRGSSPLWVTIFLSPYTLW